VPLTIDVSVNGSQIGQVVVRNVGHPETGDHPDTDDLRRYLVTDSSSGRTVHVEHRRSDGALALAADALARLEQDRTR
jgi:hypothetical protein